MFHDADLQRGAGEQRGTKHGQEECGIRFNARRDSSRRDPRGHRRRPACRGVRLDSPLAMFASGNDTAEIQLALWCR